MTLNIRRTPEIVPISMVLYGPPGSGKTTAAMKSGALLIDCERGSHSIDGASVRAENLSELCSVLREAGRDEEFHTIAIDSATAVERWLTDAIIKRNGWKSLLQGEYGKGVSELKSEWSKFVSSNEHETKRLLDKGKNVIWIAHTGIKEVDDPLLTAKYERFQPNVYPKYADEFCAAMDAVMFVRPAVIVSQRGDKTITTATAEREIILSDTPSVIAKCRNPNHPLIKSLTHHINNFQPTKA